MKAWVWVMMALGLALYFAQSPVVNESSATDQISEARQAAQYYVSYRNAAVIEALRVNISSGSLADSAIGQSPPLSLPIYNQADAGTFYVWADLSDEAFYQATVLLNGTITFGRADAGELISNTYGNTGIVLPGFVPDGSAVTAIISSN